MMNLRWVLWFQEKLMASRRTAINTWLSENMRLEDGGLQIRSPPEENILWNRSQTELSKAFFVNIINDRQGMNRFSKASTSQNSHC